MRQHGLRDKATETLLAALERCAMDLAIWLAFTVSSLLLLAAPGPMVALIVTRVSARGFASAVPLAFGAATGDAAALALSLAGLGTLLQASSDAFAALKLVGAGYLIWLAVRALRTPAKERVLLLPQAASFREAFLLTALHPGGFVFFVAYLPLFIDPNRPAASQFALLGVTFVALSALSVLAWASFGAAGGALLRRPSVRRSLPLLGGAMMASLGFATAFEAVTGWLKAR